MGFTEIIKTEDIQLKNAILLEGLPGVGNVGKLAATHLIEELKAKKCMEIYSSHFPPQVLIDDYLASLKAAFTVEEVRVQIEREGLDHLIVDKNEDRYLAVAGVF